MKIKLALSLMMMLMLSFIKPNNNLYLMIWFMITVITVLINLNFVNKMTLIYMCIMIILSSGMIMMLSYLLMNLNNFKIKMNLPSLIFATMICLNEPLIQFFNHSQSMNFINSTQLIFKIFNFAMNQKIWIIVILMIMFLNTINLMIISIKKAVRKF